MLANEHAVALSSAKAEIQSLRASVEQESKARGSVETANVALKARISEREIRPIQVTAAEPPSAARKSEARELLRDLKEFRESMITLCNAGPDRNSCHKRQSAESWPSFKPRVEEISVHIPRGVSNHDISRRVQALVTEMNTSGNPGVLSELAQELELALPLM